MMRKIILTTSLYIAAATLPFLTGTAIALDNTDPFGLQIAVDINPDPHIVEINLEARVDYVEMVPGIASKVYTYNGSVPGPMIKATVGDTLIVHFTNNLPEPTTIHWHGLRLPADMDGASVAQNPIQPGKSFRYEFELKDASLFWYHPHVRSNEQVEKGLAGSILVAPRSIDDSFHEELHDLDQTVLVLDDVLLNKNGQVEEAFAGTAEEILLEKINGRAGNTLLVNGKQLPTMKVESGESIRWRMVNVANTRFMKVAVPGHKLTRIGGDGGMLESAITNLDDVMLVSGERADIILTPVGKPGSEIIVYWKDVQRGRHSVDIATDGTVMLGDDPLDGNYPDIPLMKLVFKKDTHPHVALKIPDNLHTIPVIDIKGAAQTTLKFGHTTPQSDGTINFLINGKTFPELTSHDAPDAKVGETQVWDLVNMTGGDHPFHLHGFFFQVLETTMKDNMGNIIGVIPAPQIEDKDIVNLPHRPGEMGTSTTVRIAVKFAPADGLNADDIKAFGGVASIVNADLDNDQRGHSGGWQFHCHILEHADLGMMSFVEVRK